MSDRFNLTALALRQRELSWFFIFVIGIAGILSYSKLGQREDPDFTFRGMVIRTQWPGATPQQVDEQITVRIIKKLQEVPYYRRTSSYSRSGESIIILELLDTAPREQVQQLWYQVRKKIGDIQYTLPPGIIGPNFNDEFGDVFGSIYAFTGDGFSLEELRRYAEIARQQLIKLPDVAKVDLVGVQPEQITVAISTQRLATLGIAPLAIAQAIQSQNIVQDAGRLHAADFSVPLRVRGNFESVNELTNLPLRVNGRTLRLGDIAEITRGYLDPPETTMRYAGKPAIGLAISMKQRGDVLRLGDDLNREMNTLQSQLPIGISFARVSNQPAVVKEAVGEFMSSFLEAVAIVLLVSFASLGFRAGMGDIDPAARVVVPQVRNERQVYIDRGQMLRLARACPHRPTRAAIRIAFYSGMRLSEIERAERVPGAFVLADTKNGSPRIVPMHPKVRACSEILLGSRYQTGYHFRRARAAVGMPWLHFHDLRHACAAALINSGVGLYTVGGVLGHKSATSTKRYAHLATETLRAAIERIGRKAA